MPDLSKSKRRARYALPAIVLALPAIIAGSAVAGEVRDIEVEHTDGSYRVYIDTAVTAPREDIEALLTDFEGLNRLNPSIEHSEIIGTAPSGGTRVLMRLRMCEFFLCRSLTRVEVVTHEGPGVLRSVIEPGGTDFKSGTTEWWLAGETGGTRLIYWTTFEPDFWVPPLIGPPLIAHRLREELSVLVKNLETLAKARAAERGCSDADGVC